MEWGFLTVDCCTKSIKENKTKTSKNKLAKIVLEALVNANNLSCVAVQGKQNAFAYPQTGGDIYEIRCITQGKSIWWSGNITNAKGAFLIDVISDPRVVYWCEDHAVLLKNRITKKDVTDAQSTSVVGVQPQQLPQQLQLPQDVVDIINDTVVNANV